MDLKLFEASIHALVPYFTRCASIGQSTGDLEPEAVFPFLREAGIDTVQTTVGDRFVYENMVEHGHVIGGEQSGHIILRKYATTGDGLLTAIMLMERVAESKLPLSKLAEPVVMYPQITKNLPVPDRDAVMANPAVKAKLAECNTRLGQNGRLLLRKSGTEPVVRIMAEAADEATCRAFVQEMADTIAAENLTCEEFWYGKEQRYTPYSPSHPGAFRSDAYPRQVPAGAYRIPLGNSVGDPRCHP
jgi:hypothetical protein